MSEQLSTDRSQQSPRGIPSGEDGTRDPLFLLQCRRWIYFVNHAHFRWPDGWTMDDDGEIYDEDGEAVSNKAAADAGCCEGWWETERVFATREEARAYGERRGYDYGTEGEGWRVYSVPCEGALTDLLVRHWRPEGGGR